MSTTYMPRRKHGVARTPHSYKDGGFDANVDGQRWLGQLHAYLKLPTAQQEHRRDPPYVPWTSTAAQTQAMAERLTTALEMFRITDGFLVAWRDFLATCGGYTT